MFTIIETPTFAAAADQLWSEDERAAFYLWLASNPAAGDVIPGSGGCRKVRWSLGGMGKRGGARIIYFNRTQAGEIWLLAVYVKADRENIPSHILKTLREEIEND